MSPEQMQMVKGVRDVSVSVVDSAFRIPETFEQLKNTCWWVLASTCANIYTYDDLRDLTVLFGDGVTCIAYLDLKDEDVVSNHKQSARRFGCVIYLVRAVLNGSENCYLVLGYTPMYMCHLKTPILAEENKPVLKLQLASEGIADGAEFLDPWGKERVTDAQ